MAFELIYKTYQIIGNGLSCFSVVFRCFSVVFRCIYVVFSLPNV
jgi:hypothetical protein